MDQMDIIILLLGIIVLTTLLNLWTWYGDINRHKRHMEAQTKLLAQIAASNGVDKEKIAEIVAQAVM
jgi:alkylhydroperoxidase/carboxymuconolactone decarboxylase family protein YurZ